MTEKEFLTYLKSRKRLFLYGAGKVAKRVLQYCQSQQINVEGIIVSDLSQNPSELNGICVWSIKKLQESGIEIREIDLLVTILVWNAKDTSFWNDFLFELPFHSRMTLPKATNKWLSQRNRLEEAKNASEKLVGYQADLGNKNAEAYHTVVMELKHQKPFCRCEIAELINDTPAFQKYCLTEAFEAGFGSVPVIPYSDEIVSDNIANYVVLSHLDKANVSEIAQQGYLPIQVGAAFTDIRKGCQTDDIGINISLKNRDYSECTAIYWIWKNTQDQRYVGINHYRRRLLLDRNSFEYIKDHDIDVVLALPHFCTETVKEFFSRFVSQHDWAFLKEKIAAYNKDYLTQWEQYENGHFLFHGNLALWKWEWFDRYCEFIFSITFAIEEEYTRRGVIRQDRYMGYLIENLTSFFVRIHQKEMHLACTEMKWIE